LSLFQSYVCPFQQESNALISADPHRELRSEWEDYTDPTKLGPRLSVEVD
jgi:hypothetical protein